MAGISPGPSFGHSSDDPVFTREELVTLLTQAGDLEHGLACVCLFAAYSLKGDVSEGGLTGKQADMVRGWRQHLVQAAVKRMRNLAQLSNLLTAIGAELTIARPTLSGLTLEPFSPQLLDRLVAYGRLSAPIMQSIPTTHTSNGDQIFPVDLVTIGDLYDRIAMGFGSIAVEELFIGSKDAQADPRLLNSGDKLITVVDQESARAALAELTEAKEDIPGKAGGIFSNMRIEYSLALEDAQQMKLPFEPTRPVAADPVTHPTGQRVAGSVIVESPTREVADLFNGAYDVMLLMLRHFFMQVEETDALQPVSLRSLSEQALL